MKKLLSTALITLLLGACSGHRATMPEAEYALMDSVPYNVETNTLANSYIVHSYPGQVMFRVEYPEYKAIVKYGIATINDSVKFKKAYGNQVARMGDRVYYGDFSMDSVFGPDVKGWIFTSLPDKAPLQMIVTDSATMFLHGRLEFTEPVTDTVGMLEPAVEYIYADMEHLIHNLRLD